MFEAELKNRYLRQIIIPEVGKSGQKRLRDSFVSVWGGNVKSAASTLYYIAASGIGHINCHLDDDSGFVDISASIHDLNDGVSIAQSDQRLPGIRILIGSPEFILNKQNAALANFVPTVISLYYGLKGCIKVFYDADGLSSFFSKLSGLSLNRHGLEPQTSKLSYCFEGALSTVEAIKHILGIGKRENNFLYFNLLYMQFLKYGDAELGYMLQKMILPDKSCPSDIDLKSGRVLIAGTGGLGSPAAYALSLSGIGTLGLVDYDCVDMSNLNRQILHSTSRLGMPKVESAEIFLKGVNPSTNIKKYEVKLSADNIFDIIHEYDVIICAVDNFPARFLLNDACHLKGKPMIDAGVLRFDGNCMTIVPKSGPCYRCLLPDIPDPGSTPSCSEYGVLGPIPGVMGFIQASEAIKLILNIGAPLLGRAVLYEGLSLNFEVVSMGRNINCKLCGNAPSINKLQHYS